MIDNAYLLAQHALEQRRIEFRGQVDTLFTLSLTTAEIGNHQPRLFHQTVGLGEQRRTAIGQTVFGAAGATLLGDAVRVGQRQQRAEPARVIGVGHRLRGLAP